MKGKLKRHRWNESIFAGRSLIKNIDASWKKEQTPQNAMENKQFKLFNLRNIDYEKKYSSSKILRIFDYCFAIFHGTTLAIVKSRPVLEFMCIVVRCW